MLDVNRRSEHASMLLTLRVLIYVTAVLRYLWLWNGTFQISPALKLKDKQDFPLQPLSLDCDNLTHSDINWGLEDGAASGVPAKAL